MILTVLSFACTLSLPFAKDSCGSEKCTQVDTLDDEVSLIQTWAQSQLKSKTPLGPEDHLVFKHVLPEPYFWFWGHPAQITTDPRHRLSLLQIHSPVVEAPSSNPQVLQNPPPRKSYSQYGQDLTLMPILDRLGKGFFVESGALNGEVDSNTLLYEVEKGWTGLLVEPSPRMYKVLKTKHRKAYTFNGCLSPSGNEETLHFDPEVKGMEGSAHITPFSLGSVNVPAAPLELLLRKINRSTVDFWSLDIEGSESQVLRNTNFSNVEVGVLLIEMNKNSVNDDGVFEVMRREGFHNIGHTNYFKGVLDRIFVNPKYFQKRGLAVPTPLDLAQENRELESAAWRASVQCLGLVISLSMFAQMLMLT